MDTLYLVLENGKIFKGKSFGAKRPVCAEVVFTTGMTGYLETLTDPSYYGQIVVQTFPLIGNYGVISEDFESKKSHVSAYIVKHLCEEPSNFRSEGALDTFFKSQGIVGLSGIDTRALTKIIREEGTMNGCITDSISGIDFEKMRNYKVSDAVLATSVKEAYEKGPENADKHIALFDFGMKNSILKSLLERGCKVTVVPYNTKKEEIKKLNPSGIVLSNGPGDPKDNMDVVENIKELLELKIPIFGISLGHQLLALANGFDTIKLKYGHRGSSQPVRDNCEDKVLISSQNHGYAVSSKSVDESVASELFVNLNDDTNEGLLYKNYPAFSVQFDPSLCSGTQKAGFLYDKFIKMTEGR